MVEHLMSQEIAAHQFKMELVDLSDIILIETILILIRSRFLEIIPLRENVSGAHTFCLMSFTNY